ncbi:MAG: hypothetical protein AB8H80_06840 [Planctomycetota bacterium]
MKSSNLVALTLSAMLASCGTVQPSETEVSFEAQSPSSSPAAAPDETTAGTPAAAPAGETATPDAVEQAIGQDEAGQAASSPAKRRRIVETQMNAGTFPGDLVLDKKRMSVRGAGAGKTIIDGNLILTSQCQVTDVTVTGDIIFRGNSAEVRAECLGQVLDYGMFNRY